VTSRLIKWELVYESDEPVIKEKGSGEILARVTLATTAPGRSGKIVVTREADQESLTLEGSEADILGKHQKEIREFLDRSK
jgi:hypothetical protein